MKLILFFLLIFPSYLFAKETYWSKLNTPQKEYAIKLLQEFSRDYSKLKMEADFLEEKHTSLYFLISNAYASEGYTCFYAGWPSVEISSNGKKYCTSPKNKNLTYQEKYKDSCEGSALKCNPILFGEGLCVPQNTREERVYSFSNCEGEAKKSGKTIDDIISTINKDKDLQTEFEKTLNSARQICKGSGFQASTGMCRILLQRISLLEGKYQPSEKIVDEVLPNSPKAPKEIKDLEKETEEKIIAELQKINNKTLDLNTAKSSCNLNQGPIIPESTNAEYWEISEQIDQNKKTPDNYCHSYATGSNYERYSQTKYTGTDYSTSHIDLRHSGEKDQKERQVDGFSIDAGKYGKEYSYIENGNTQEETYYPSRSYGFDFPERGKESVFTIIDAPIKEIYDSTGKIKERYPSTDLKITNYFFFPRKVVPSITQRDNKTFVTLTTGEVVTFDKESGKVTGGVFKESKTDQIETRPNQKRIYPNSKFTYEGDGIWIESRTLPNAEESKPGHTLSIYSKINGKLSTCKMKSEDLFYYTSGQYLPKDDPNHAISTWSCRKFKFEKDEEFYSKVKKKCPSFKIPEL